MLTIHHSNRLDALVDSLARVTRAPLASPFATEVVVVQSRGVARWLSLRLADTAGICANVHFPFPTAFAWALYRAVCGDDLPERAPYAPEVLAWHILGALAELETKPAFAPVRDYVRGDPLRRFELATRLAGLYDEYLVYRPDWIAAWERGDAKHWQGELWRRIASEAGTPHRAALHAQLLNALEKGRVATGIVPERVSVFGAPALPPALLDLFSVLGRHSEVHLFVQNPCREYWGDIADEASIAKKALAKQAEARYLESGNRLLASLGKQGRDFFDLLAAIDHDAVEQTDAFVEPMGQSLLASIQSDILALRERSGDAARASIARDDRSLQIHSCHSAMREAEVLHDQLLGLFSAHPDIEPSDVVVMTPDIETYAPYIEAVFGTATPRIPFNLSDRSAEKSSTLASAYTALLALPGSRYEAHRVLALLDEPAVRRRFGLSEADVETVRRWVRESQIRWGIDGEHRASFGVPPAHEHTWRFGLERLLLGYALPAHGERLFAGVLPYDEIEGSLGEVLGRFASFAEAAIALDAKLAGARPIARWCDALHAVIADFFDASEERAEELEAVRSAVAAIENEARTANFEGAVPFKVVLTALSERLEAPGRAFLSGGVTFCAMVPMRSLPFEIVCMIGMNDRAYPRIRRRDGFDLMANDFRKGDRSRRDDDRYLFLESILNARRCVYLSYTGRHIREDTVMPPSVLVSELIDYVAHGYEPEGGGDVRERFVTGHPLQAFSPRYFEGDERLFSYSEPLARAAAAAGRGTRESAPLLESSLPAPEEMQREIDLESLISFFRNPTRYFMRERLGIRLESAEDEIQPREPFAIETLDAYGLRQQLLDRRLNGTSGDSLAIAHAAGILPHGLMGDGLFQREDDTVQAFARKLAPLRGAARVEPVALAIDCGDVRVTGTLGGVTEAGLLLYRAAKLTVNDRIGGWLRHLALNAAKPAGVRRETRVVAQDATLEFAPVEDARDTLRDLLSLYREGLRRPLHFFPKTACEYATSWSLTNKVRTTWGGSEYTPAERDENAYYRLAFRSGDPLDEEFERLTRLVLEPLYAALARSSQ